MEATRKTTGAERPFIFLDIKSKMFAPEGAKEAKKAAAEANGVTPNLKKLGEEILGMGENGTFLAARCSF